MASLSSIEMINNFNNSELKYLLDKQREDEQIDTILHISSTIINISSIVLSTLAGIQWHYLSFVAIGLSSGTVLFGATIKANTQVMINNNITINYLLKSLKINETVPLLNNLTPTQTTPVNTPNSFFSKYNI